MKPAERYESLNAGPELEADPFTEERYQQFADLVLDQFGHSPRSVLDIGCNTGRGGLVLKRRIPALQLAGLDCIAARVDSLPPAYEQRIAGLTTKIPVEDHTFDVIVAGEFLEHLYPHDVDATLCEFQRVLKLDGMLLLTTPNPSSWRRLVGSGQVLGGAHLSQHYPRELTSRLRMHGFSGIKLRGSGKSSRYIGTRMPLLWLYGSYLVIAHKR